MMGNAAGKMRKRKMKEKKKEWVIVDSIIPEEIGTIYRGKVVDENVV